MTTRGEARIGLKAWMSLGMALITLLVLAVAAGLLSQSSSPQSSDPFPIDRASIPVDGTGGGVIPSRPPDRSALEVAKRVCRRDLPAVLATARLADTPAEADDLKRAADRLSRAIDDLAGSDKSDSSNSSNQDERWDAALAPGRQAVKDWRSAARPSSDAASYERLRLSGLREMGFMQTRLADLGAIPC